MSNRLAGRLRILNPPLFWRKLTLLTVTMAAFVPLVVFKLQVPALIYTGALLAIHVWVFLLYIYKVQWRSFSKAGLYARLGSVLIFGYLLSKIRFSGGVEVLWAVALSFALHVLILVILMVKVEKPKEEQA